MFTTNSTALGMFLAIAVIVLLVRKLLIGDVDNYSRAIIPIVLVLSLVGLICSLIACAGAVKLDLMSMSSTENAQIKNNNIVSLVIGYVSLSFNYLMLKIIEKKNKRKQPKQENHWDLDKLK